MRFRRHSVTKLWYWIFLAMVACAVVVFFSMVMPYGKDDASVAFVAASGIGYIIFSGEITVNGEIPNRTGFELTAKIRDEYESLPIIVGDCADGQSNKYCHLIVVAPDDLIGSEIEFWLDGQVKSTHINYYGVLRYEDGTPCRECVLASPIPRTARLDFPYLPESTSTSAPMPTAVPEPPPTGGTAVSYSSALLVAILGIGIFTLGIAILWQRISIPHVSSAPWIDPVSSTGTGS